ncbi:MAG: hypothetical protein ACE5D1_06050, partial [Fidelibacterota bacterium]
ILVQFAKSASGNSELTWERLLASDSIQVDSIFMQFAVQADSTTLLPDVEAVNFATVSDSIFNESTSNYLNFSEPEYSQGVSIGTGRFVLIPPDTGNTFLRWDLSPVITSFTDSLSSRTIGLNLVSGTGDLLRLMSRESSDPPQILVDYRTFDSDGNVVDTLSRTFVAIKDLTIATPPPVSEQDRQQLSVSAGRGFKSIVNIDLAPLDSLSGMVLIDLAELRLPVVDSTYNSGLKIQFVPVADTLVSTGYLEKERDDISIQGFFTMDASIDSGYLKVNLKTYLQAIRQKSFPNLGIKLYAMTVTNPFDVIHFSTTTNPRLRVLYVQSK